MHANRRSILGILVVAIVISLGAAIAVANLCPRARASNREPALAQLGWRLAQPITYENLTIFPVITSQDADTSEFVDSRPGARLGRSGRHRGRLRLPSHAPGRRASSLLHRRAGESTGLHQSRQAPANSSGRRGRLRWHIRTASSARTASCRPERRRCRWMSFASSTGAGPAPPSNSAPRR